jgi:hypothetical protein
MLTDPFYDGLAWKCFFSNTQKVCMSLYLEKMFNTTRLTGALGGQYVVHERSNHP